MMRPQILLKRVEWLLAILLTGMSIFFLVIRASHAGPLWRDECGTVGLATAPTLAQVAEYFDHQTFPPLVPLILRGCIRMFGESDAALRSFGLAAGIGFIGAAWIHARVASKGVPLLSLAFFGLNPIFLTWGTTVSGYGFGAALIVLVLAMNARLLLLKPTASAILVTLLVALASQQFLISNLTLVITIGLSALIVLVIHRDFRTAGIVGGITGCAAAIGAIYLRIFSSGEWRVLLRHRISLSDLWGTFTQACGPDATLVWLWRACFVAIVVGGPWFSRRRLSVIANNNVRALQFALFVTVLSPIAYFTVLLVVGYRTHPWHYLPLLALLPAAMDTIVSAAASACWFRGARLIFAIVAAIVVGFPSWSASHRRQSNIDIVASKLAESARPHDLIIVAPWQLGISFQRYYHGGAQWITLPTVTNHRMHRYDLMLDKMISAHPIDDVLESISHTLASGNRVWFVGEMRLPEPGNPPLSLPPAPNDRFGWDESAYSESWLEQVGTFLHVHGEHGRSVLLPSAGAINQFEDVPVFVVDGWQ